MNPVWLFPLAAVVLALAVAALADRAIRQGRADLGAEVERLGDAREHLSELASTASELRDSGHPPTRR